MVVRCCAVCCVLCAVGCGLWVVSLSHTALMLSAIAPKKDEVTKLATNSAHHLDLMTSKGGSSNNNSFAPAPGTVARNARRSLSQGSVKVPAHIQKMRSGAGAGAGAGAVTPKRAAPQVPARFGGERGSGG